MHIDMPSRDDVERLAGAVDPHSVSIYLPTGTRPTDVEQNRLEARALVRTALDRMTGPDDRDAAAAIREHLEDILDDAAFWAHQGRSLAIFATPGSVVEFRLPNRLEPSVTVSDRFAITPLLRAVTFPNSAFVLALSHHGARLVEVSSDLPAEEVEVPDMPDDAPSSVGLPSIAGRAPCGRLQGSEGTKVRLTQYARAVDHALRPLLNGESLPLIVAAAEPLASIYRNLAGYAAVADEVIAGNPDEATAAQLAEAARGVLDRRNAAELDELRATFEDRRSSGRAATDLADLARAAAFGAVATLAVDMTAEVPGTVGEDGSLTPGPTPGTTPWRRSPAGSSPPADASSPCDPPTCPTACRPRASSGTPSESPAPVRPGAGFRPDLPRARPGHPDPARTAVGETPG